ncbi:Sulfotransferase domain-containing protein [Porphyrobacter sp. LM 6]|nr:Sulfotransferase domain-containing protein [Porphyrobacter sp. LM 6]
MSEPNFLYIGTSKSGSTWIFKVLSWHPQIAMYGGKDLNFFTHDYAKGWDWYVSQFDNPDGRPVVGEVSHGYLASPEACERIHAHLPNAKLMVCLREPVDRTFSQYLDGLKNGKMSGTLEEEIERSKSLTDRNRYGSHLEMYLERFPREQIHIASFDELNADPDAFAAKMFAFLGVDPLPLPPELRKKVMPAATPRIRSVAMAAKKVAKFANAIGLSKLRGSIKKSRLVRHLLYRPFKDAEKPKISPAQSAQLRAMFTPEIQRLDRVAGTNFGSLWNYPKDGTAGG